MSKSLRVVAFMALASLGNILITGLLFVALLGLYSLTLSKILPAEAVIWVLMICFVLSLVGAVFVYKKFLALLRKDGRLDAWLGMKPGK
jgi:peptidoglycan/LPS O-acetylase OafA/YrhL